MTHESIPLVFRNTLNPLELEPGDCIIELPLVGQGGDDLAVRPEGVVTLGHHPGGYDALDGLRLTCAAWQAWLLVCAAPGWQPRRMIRPLHPINPDDVLASLLADPATREPMLQLKSFPALLMQIATTDVLGPLGYRALERRDGGVTLLNAVNNRATESLPALGDDPIAHARQRHRQLADAMLAADTLEPERVNRQTSLLMVVREDGRTVMAETIGNGLGSSAMAALYAQGYARVILLTSPDEQKRRRCTVGQAASVVADVNGLPWIAPAIDWERPRQREIGWGGRASIGGGPREGTALDLDALWECLRIG